VRAPAPLVCGREAVDRRRVPGGARLVVAVTRNHGIGTGQLYQWRHQLLGTGRVKVARFARIEVVDERYHLKHAVPAGLRLRGDRSELRCAHGVPNFSRAEKPRSRSRKRSRSASRPIDNRNSVSLMPATRRAVGLMLAWVIVAG
jgi:transposase-like protein